MPAFLFKKNPFPKTQRNPYFCFTNSKKEALEFIQKSIQTNRHLRPRNRVSANDEFLSSAFVYRIASQRRIRKGNGYFRLHDFLQRHAGIRNGNCLFPVLQQRNRQEKSSRNRYRFCFLDHPFLSSGRITIPKYARKIFRNRRAICHLQHLDFSPRRTSSYPVFKASGQPTACFLFHNKNGKRHYQPNPKQFLFNFSS